MADRIAVITGAGQGIGQTVARKLAALGMVPILIGRDSAKLTETARLIEHAHGLTAVPLAVDLADLSQMPRLLAAIQRQTQQVDMLINAAGEALIQPFDATTPEDWARILANNLTAPYFLTQALLPLLRASANPSIVNLVSKVALRAYGGGVTAYAAAKTGLLGWTRTLAAELAPEAIRVVAVCPGPVNTPMRRAATPDFDPRFIIEPETIADLIAHIVTLPRGVTFGEVLIQSVHYD